MEIKNFCKFSNNLIIIKSESELSIAIASKLLLLRKQLIFFIQIQQNTKCRAEVEATEGE